MPLSGDFYSTMHDLAYNPVNHKLYGIAYREIYEINPCNGYCTYAGYLEYLPWNDSGRGAIAFSTTGQLFVQFTNFDQAYEITNIYPFNYATVSPLAGALPAGALGMGYEPGTNLLIGSNCCDQDDQDGKGESLYTLDPATGTATLLFDFADGRRIQDIAFPQSSESPLPTAGTIRGFKKFRDTLYALRIL